MNEDGVAQGRAVTGMAGLGTAGGAGRLILAATPIGDRSDASPRLAELLATADLVAAEDTRRLRRLLDALGVTPRGRIVSHHEHNEQASAAGLVAQVADGATVLLVTDAGMPTVSDPGYRVVRAAIEAGLTVTAVPGPSAVLTALAVSGLPTDRFTFEGFPARRPGERARQLAALNRERRTMVFFEAPHRLAALLADLAGAFGALRAAVVCRELTKTHEEVLRGTLGELTDWANRTKVLGETTLVVSGAAEKEEQSPEDLLAAALRRVASGEPPKAAAKAVAAEHGVPSRMVYDLVVTARKATRDPQAGAPPRTE